VMLLAPVIEREIGEFRDVIERLARDGFIRARIDGRLVELETNVRVKLDPAESHTIEVVVDRLIVNDKIRVRLGDSVETALKLGNGKLVVLSLPPDATPSTEWSEALHSNRMYSPATGRSFDPPAPGHFSFNSPSGACPECHGLGQTMVFDPELIVPDPEKTLNQGAVLAWKRGGKKMTAYYESLLKGLANHFDAPLDKKWRLLPAPFREAVLCGTGDEPVEFGFWREGKLERIKKPFEGVLNNLAGQYADSESENTRSRLAAFMGPRPCSACDARRLKPEILAIRLGPGVSAISPDKAPNRLPGLSIMDVCSLTVNQADAFIRELRLTDFQHSVAADLLREIRARLGFLSNVGLGYLTLDRESGTLSGGEAQRIRLATQIGAGLVGVVYILDEPSIGLHQRDNERLLETLCRLRDIGNSVLVVEHDEDTIRRADHVIDMGPGAGVHGGEVVAVGTPAEIATDPRSLTGKYLSGALSIPLPDRRVKPDPFRGWLEIKGATGHNLKDVHARFPVSCLSCVTGVSGSGKSTLVEDTLRRALFRKWYGSKEKPAEHRAIKGDDKFDKIIVIDQSAIGRTPRSNPATYTGIFNLIRDLFAKLPAAKIRGYGPGRFSFNVKGGRCEKCLGDGLLKIEMQFLPPVYVTCDACNGRRYNRETLEINYKGVNIADVLDMTVDDAVNFFRAIPQIQEVCRTLAEVGLGYVKLGQQATTLSGGEAQRVKLAAELARKSTGKTLYILDEPTTGLHFHDVAKLLDVLFRLRDAGNTLIVIEHNLDVIKCADWIIDMGPEGGDAGGEIVAQGFPDVVANETRSHTGSFLRRILPSGSP
jgi:excinuclease ABC subunit A